MPRVWRLLPLEVAPGPRNMGVDEALLWSAGARGTASLRFYRWRGPWLSLGYRQQLDPLVRARCAAAGVGIVRRATGGGAVLHGGDLTYALAVPRDALPRRLPDAYGLIAEALREALASLDVAVALSPDSAHSGVAATFDCFAAAGVRELLARGRKLAGSAQRRAGGAVLQHGSIRLEPDAAGARAAASLQEGAAISLRELGCGASPRAVLEACVGALARSLGAHFEPDVLSPQERHWAGSRADWTPVAPCFSVEGSPSRTSRSPFADR